MANLTSLISQLQLERRLIAAQLEGLNRALAALNTTGSRKGRISAAGRARIAAAQRARRRVVSIRSRKRKLSAVAIARIRAAQKARWAKWRKQQTA